MREIFTENLKIGEHIRIDGVEYVAEEANDRACDSCALAKSNKCYLIPCDGVILESVDSNWHTGTPTEKGWYLCKTKGRKGSYLPSVLRWNGEIWTSKTKRPIVLMDVVEWQKIEPYRG